MGNKSSKRNRQLSCMTIWQFSYMAIHLERHLDNDASQYREIDSQMTKHRHCHMHVQCIYMHIWQWSMKYIMDFELTGLVQIGEQVYKMTTSCILYIYFCLKTMKMGTWYKMAMET